MGQAVSQSECLFPSVEVWDWDCEAVEAWLDNNDFRKIAKSMKKEKINGLRLIMLDDEELIDLGVQNKEHRARLLFLIKELYNQSVNMNSSLKERSMIEECTEKLKRMKQVTDNADDAQHQLSTIAKHLVLKRLLLLSYMSDEWIVTRKLMRDFVKGNQEGIQASIMVPRGKYDTPTTSSTLTIPSQQPQDQSSLINDGNSCRKLQKMYDELMAHEKEILLEESKNKSSDDNSVAVGLVIWEESPEVLNKQSFQQIFCPVKNRIMVSNDLALFRTGLLIGDWLLEWNETGFVIPKKCYFKAKKIISDVTLKLDEISKQRIYDVVPDIICNWNAHYKYDAKERNCQHFVEEVCSNLGITLKQEGPLHTFMSAVKSNGGSSIHITYSDRLKRVLGLNNNEQEKTFSSHKELDDLVQLILTKDRRFFFSSPDEWQLLKSLDRAFWVHFSEQQQQHSQTEKWKPDKVNAINCSTSCPFYHPFRATDCYNTNNE